MQFSELTEEEKTTHVDMSGIITPDILTLEKVFKGAGFDIRLVGGAVRDLLLAEEPKDMDFATDATPDEMKKIFDRNHLSWIPTGEQHGTLTVLGPKEKEPFEITTLRIDTEHTGRHAEVEFTKSWEEDSKRRDLTYNALSADLDGTVYDYHNGISDLKSGITRFVGDADERIREDYLRILRMFRFSARYGHDLSLEQKAAVQRNVQGLSDISGERVWSEIGKILSGNNSAQSLVDMKKTGVADIIGLPVNKMQEFEAVNTLTNNPVTLIMKLANTQEELNHFINNWKWSNPEKKLGQFILENKFETFNSKKAQIMVIDGIPSEFVEELAYVLQEKEIADFISTWVVPEFPIQGRDLIALGMKEGPEMGKAIKSMKLLWKESEFLLTKEELLNTLNLN